MIVGEDFEFVDTLKTDTAAIRLLCGPYKDVVYRYTTMAIRENEDDSATLSFDYELLQLAEHYETKLRKDIRFQEHLGLILNTLILELVDKTQEEQQST
jgi:hypothetical protein